MKSLTRDPLRIISAMPGFRSGERMRGVLTPSPVGILYDYMVDTSAGTHGAYV